MHQITDRTGVPHFFRIGFSIGMLLASLLFWIPDGSAAAAAPKTGQQAFASPEAAVGAMLAAMQADDEPALSRIFGRDGLKMLSLADVASTRELREAFCKIYQEKNRLEWVGDSKVILHTGLKDWSFPVPITRIGQNWIFDTKEGKEEILNRRIGRDELGAVQVCLAFVDAQKEYALGDHDRDGYFEYAQQFVSDPGRKNGLYWETKEGEKPSPMGPAIAMASIRGNQKLKSGTRPIPYYGYYYKILKAQGKNAPGGAYDYMANGKMLGGFALVAYPAEYGTSGIMTFTVSMDGVVYEKNFGKNTARLAESITRYDPDKTWKITEYGHTAN